MVAICCRKRFLFRLMGNANLFAWIDKMVGFVFRLQLLGQNRSEVDTGVVRFFGVFQHRKTIAAYGHVGVHGNEVVAPTIERLRIIGVQ